MRCRLLTLLILVARASAFAESPFTTKQVPVTDVYHGVKVVDQYRWLEDGSDPAVQEWSDAQNARTRKYLDHLPQIEAVRDRIAKIMSAPAVRYGDLVYRGGKLFTLKDEPPKQQPFLVVMDSPEAAASARVLVDPAVLDPDSGTAIDWFVPSHDGRHVAVSLSQGGTESGDVHVYETDTGHKAFEAIPRVNGGTAGGDLAWLPDGSGFFYTRYPRGDERAPADRDFHQQLYFHKLGTPTGDDRYELGRDLPRIAEIQLEIDAKSGRLLATVQNGDGGEFAHYLRSPDGQWRQFSNFGDKTILATFGPDGDLFVVSRRDAPRGRILRVPGDTLNVARARTIVPESEDAIIAEFWGPSSVLATDSRLYVLYQLGGPSEVRVFDHNGRPQPKPRQPDVASAGGLTALTGDELLFEIESYIDPPAVYQFNPADGTTARTALATDSPVRFDDVEVVREFAESQDGTRVPVNIIRPKSLKLDGSNPCVATGYGGYGVSNEPRFRATTRILLDQGIVYAVANIRGGGEYGEEWHRQGNLTNKQNVFDDFAASLEHLIDRGYTDSLRLAIIGGSNGGLLMGATLTQHPELARCVVSYVGIYDMLRVELSPNGEFNITEFGTVKDPQQFQALFAYSPYHHVQDGTGYPAVLFLTGENDPRVEPMQSRKMTARLQAATASGHPVLLRTSSGTGHGGDTPLAEQIAETADAWAFLFDQLGIRFE